MRIIYELIVYEKNKIYFTGKGTKTTVLSEINDIMSHEMNKDITFNIKMAQK